MPGLPDQAPPAGGAAPLGADDGLGLNPLDLREGEKRVKRLTREGHFRFHCHAELSCFTECCRELELALSPYDVARLREALGQSSLEFIAEYAIIEFGPDDRYPKVYLAMVDDGRASCPYVTPSGCRVYQDRPAACRSYPVGRGASLDQQGLVREQFVLITEPHCLGFAEERRHSISGWQQEQGLADYNQSNDLLLPLFCDSSRDQAHRRLTDAEALLYIDTLYGLDRLPVSPCAPTASVAVADGALALIAFAVNHLKELWRSAP